ncbi:hypothetical protein ACOMHN_002172 [Nucella lapillus]
MAITKLMLLDETETRANPRSETGLGLDIIACSLLEDENMSDPQRESAEASSEGSDFTSSKVQPEEPHTRSRQSNVGAANVVDKLPVFMREQSMKKSAPKSEPPEDSFTFRNPPLPQMPSQVLDPDDTSVHEILPLPQMPSLVLNPVRDASVWGLDISTWPEDHVAPGSVHDIPPLPQMPPLVLNPDDDVSVWGLDTSAWPGDYGTPSGQSSTKTLSSKAPEFKSSSSSSLSVGAPEFKPSSLPTQSAVVSSSGHLQTFTSGMQALSLTQSFADTKSVARNTVTARKLNEHPHSYPHFGSVNTTWTQPLSQAVCSAAPFKLQGEPSVPSAKDPAAAASATPRPLPSGSSASVDDKTIKSTTYSEKLMQGNTPTRETAAQQSGQRSIKSSQPWGLSSSGVTSSTVERIEANARGVAKVLVLVIMRGLPGSGKSFLAKKIQGSGQIFSTDDFFMRNGRYRFSAEQLPVAHQWNKQRVIRALEKRVTPVIVDNTNMQFWEMYPYGRMAYTRGYIIEILEPDTPWNFKPSRLAKLNSHGVEKDAIQRMLERFEPMNRADFMQRMHNKMQLYSCKSQEGPAESANPAPLARPERLTASDHGPRRTPDQNKQPAGSKSKDSRKEKQSAKTQSPNFLSIRDSCLELLRSGHTDAEIDGMLYLSQLEEKEQLAIKEYLEQFKNNNKAVEECEQSEIYVDEEEFLDDDRGLAATLERSEEDRALVSEHQDQNVAAGNRHQPRGGSGVPQSEKHNTPSVPAPQPEKMSRASPAAVTSGLTSAQNTDWNNPLQQIGQDRRTSKPSRGKESEERSMPRFWGNISWKLTDQKLTSGSGQPELLDRRESSSRAELSGSRKAPTKGRDSWEAPPTAEPSHKPTVMSTDAVDSAGEAEDAGTQRDETGKNESSNAPSLVLGPHQPERGGVGLGLPGLCRERALASSEPRQAERYSVTDSNVMPNSDGDEEESRLEESTEPVGESGPSESLADSLPSVSSNRSLEDELSSSATSRNLSSFDESGSASSQQDQTGDLRPLFAVSSTDKSRSSSPGECGHTGEEKNTQASGSPRKTRKKKHKSQPSPYLEDEVKVRFISDSWKNFEPEKQISETEDKVQNSDDSLKGAEHSDIEQCQENYCHADTQTEGKDFGTAVKGTVDLEEGYYVIKANNYFRCSENVDIFTRRKVKNVCDKSSMVDISEESSVEEMHKLFPEVAEAHLNEVLEVCHGEVDMAVDLLFEWGLTVPLTPDDKLSLYNETFPHTSEMTAETDAKLKVRLLDLCVKKLNQAGIDNHLIQQKVIDSSQQRLKRLESSEYQRLRSLNWESSQGTPVGVHLPPDLSLSAFTSGEVWASDSSPEPSEAGKFQSALGEDRCETEGLDSSQLGDSGGSQRVFGAQAAARKREGESAHLAEGDLTVSLPACLVSNLEQLFGCLPIADRGAAASRTVQLDHKTARGLYQCLLQSLPADKVFSEEAMERQLREDEALAQWLQEEEKVNSTLESIATVAPENGKAQAKRSLPSPRRTVASASKPTSLLDIMQEEEEWQKIREEQTKELEKGGDHIAMATRLKRRKLQEHFPGIDEKVIEEVFEATDYCLESTVKVIEEAMGLKKPVSHKLEMAFAGASADYDEQATLEMAKQSSLQDMREQQEGFERSHWLGIKNQLEQTYQDLRDEAMVHHYMRKECFQKASEARHMTMGEVADFYARQGHDHYNKMKDTNKRASEKLLESRYERLNQEMTLDLHGFHVEEAINVFQKVVAEKEREFQQKPPVHHRRRFLSVITGRGKHSQHGVARLRPVMIAYLQNSGYK